MGARHGLVDDLGRDTNHLVVAAMPDRRPGTLKISRASGSSTRMPCSWSRRIASLWRWWTSSSLSTRSGENGNADRGGARSNVQLGVAAAAAAATSTAVVLDPGRRTGTHLGGGLRDLGDGGVELCGDRFRIGGELEFVERAPSRPWERHAANFAHSV